MLDITSILTNPEEIKLGLRKRELRWTDDAIDKLIVLYAEKKTAQQNYDSLKAKQNSMNDEISLMDKGSELFKNRIVELKVLANDVEVANRELQEKEKAYFELLVAIPNVPDKDLVAGGKESNKEIYLYESKRERVKDIKDHLDIGVERGFLDFEAATRIGGAQLPMYVGKGAQLEWALINFFISEHIKSGYQMLMPPHLIERDTAFVAGQLPKFADDVFWVDDNHCLLPTAETAIAGYMKNQILQKENLPMKVFAYTPCYRREAGSYRANERGLMRMHQFNKVEMFQFTEPDNSDTAFEELVEKASDLVRKLDLKFRVSKLAAGDCSAGMARTYDIEVYLPYLDTFYEVSSVSNAREYQARRGNIRYRDDDGKLRFIHTLNGSGLATSRLMVAILEQYQNEDSTITVPEVLRSFMGVDKI